MIVVWLAVVVGAVALVVHVAMVANDTTAAVWPEEAPLRVRENRAQDQQVSHLARLVRADDPHALHEVVVGLAAQVRADAAAPYDDATARFLTDPPLGSAERYRRDLKAVLARIEAR